uniref:Uncharacterized protein n=1 Tax=Gadus morhua TaxID=8049 RepID=A0A8C5FS96_GADMO
GTTEGDWVRSVCSSSPGAPCLTPHLSLPLSPPSSPLTCLPLFPLSSPLTCLSPSRPSPPPPSPVSPPHLSPPLPPLLPPHLSLPLFSPPLTCLSPSRPSPPPPLTCLLPLSSSPLTCLSPSSPSPPPSAPVSPSLPPLLLPPHLSLPLSPLSAPLSPLSPPHLSLPPLLLPPHLSLPPLLPPQLARRGFNIVLISRSQEKLDDVSKAIESKCEVQTKTIAADFSTRDIYPKIEEGLAGLEIGVLVNNVGVSYGYPEFFLSIPNLDSFINTLINVNITSVCQMTSLVLPRMVQRKKGAILNISSASALAPIPLLTVYSASKAFVDFFSRGLEAEYKSQGIIIQSVLPSFVATKLSKIRRATLDKPTPQRYVAAALGTVGLQSQTSGYFPHAVLGWLTTVLLPAKLVTSYMMGMLVSQRAHYLKKQKQG